MKAIALLVLTDSYLENVTSLIVLLLKELRIATTLFVSVLQYLQNGASPLGPNTFSHWTN